MFSLKIDKNTYEENIGLIITLRCVLSMITFIMCNLLKGIIILFATLSFLLINITINQKVTNICVCVSFFIPLYVM